MTEGIFILVLFIANIIQAITGFAGTVLAMPASAYLIGLANAKVVLNALAIVSGLMIGALNFRYIRWKELGKIVVFMLVGMFAGIQICNYIPTEDMLLRIYGVIIILIALKNILVKKEMNLSNGALLVVLLLAGVIHGMFVSGGALLVIYAVQTIKDKNTFRATVAPVWVVLNTVMMVSQMSAGLYTQANIHYILLSIIPLFAATYIGGKLAQKMKQQTFLNITYVLLIISGVSLLF